MRALRFLFALEGRVSRSAYARTGFGLTALKYAVEALALRRVTGAVWTPIEYLSPFFTTRADDLRAAPPWFLLALGVWTLPFAWVGASLTLRRAVDAGWNPWTALAFFVPGVNYVLMLALAAVPSRVAPRPARGAAAARPASRLRTIGVTAFLTVGLVLFATLFARNYGTGLFIGVPFLLGVVASFLHNRGGLQSTGSTLSVVASSLCLAGLLLLLFAAEGIICLAMALPIALPSTFAGAVLGRTLAGFGSRRGGAATAGLALPFLLLGEAHVAPPAAEFEVVSSIEIDAPRERVWANVIGFSELPAPEHWIFRTGIAYPMRATIDGAGVGAVRRCEFSTGAFVEPITVWEPPARLAFDVAEHPLPMEEWSFWARVRPPHLEHAFRSARGEFRLSELPGDRTRLEGSTWYVLELAPVPYWRLVADAIVHRIHRRVLEHVAGMSER